MRASNSIYSDNGWHLCLSAGNTPDYLRVERPYYLYHYCKGRHGVCTATRDTYSGMKWPCDWCGKKIPQGLQALYVMISGDMDEG